jgi:hypothetical protein
MILMIPAAIICEEPAQDMVCFNWAFVFKDGKGTTRSIDFSTQVNTLKAGDRLKIYLEPVHNAFIYLFLYDSEKELFLLFPRTPEEFYTYYTYGRGYYIPDDEVWFYLKEEGGMEIFYLIVSRNRCERLESAAKVYLLLQEKKSAPNPALNSAKQAVLDEIRSLRKHNSVFKGLVEKPVIIAGDYRGDKTILQCAFRIEVENFYAKTIRVAH